MPEPQDIHPLLLQGYALYTKSIADMFKQIERWIDNRVTGAYIYGLSRTGKSKAVQNWFPDLLVDAYGNRIAAFRTVYTQRSASSQLGFLRALARGLNHRYAESIKTRDLEWRLANYFIVRGLRTVLKQVVLFIDEAQYLTESEFHTLCNLQNLAEEGSVRLTVITVGTHQIQQQRQTFFLAHNAHLSARFLAHRARFRGVCSSAELAYVLHGYDERTDWPEGSHTSYTQYFFPGAYANGFRLAHCASFLWDIYLQLAPAQIRERLEVPMEYAVTPIEILCRKHATEDPTFVLGPDLMADIVKMTSYVTVMRAIVGAHLLGRDGEW